MFQRHPQSSHGRCVALVAGGTAGHVNPALALAGAFQETAVPFRVLLIGTRDGLEARLVPPTGYPFEVVRAAPLFGVGVMGKVETVRSLCAGIRQARRLLVAHGAELIIGLGGYASAGTLVAAWSLGRRTAIHEANVVPGVTNKCLGRLVDRIYVGFDAAAKAFPAARTLMTGIPVRPEIAAIGARRAAPAAAQRPFRMLVTGGSLGSHFFNQHAPALMAHVAHRTRGLEVLHQTGDGAVAGVRQRYAAGRTPAVVVPYIEDMSSAYQWADFVLAHAGANTIAEVAAAGLPALLVPLATASQDHQTPNAIAFAAAGSGWWVRPSEWRSEPLATRIAGLLNDDALWRDASQRVRCLAQPDAARRLVADCEVMLARERA